MKKFLLSMLVLIYLVNHSFGQTLVDASGWYSMNNKGVERTFFVGGVMRGSYAYGMMQLGGANEVLSFDDLNNVSTVDMTLGQWEFGQCYQWQNFPVGELYITSDIEKCFYIIPRGEHSYIIELPVTDLGFHDVNFNYLAVFSIPVVIPNSASLKILEETHGAGNPESAIEADLSGVITLLSALLAEAQVERTLLQELSIQSQYQVGVLALIGGVALCFVFVFGLRIR